MLTSEPADSQDGTLTASILEDWKRQRVPRSGHIINMAVAISNISGD